jgi:NAD(P)-dependent dehydrogenase (short-subunit alcohol dehydrogenase family)
MAAGTEPAGTTHAALITGASRGIGRGVAVALGGAGFELALASRGAAGLAETAAAATEAGAPRALPLPTDLGDLDACHDLAGRAREALGREPDVFVHCAGIARNGRIGELPLQDWEESMRVNVTAAFVIAGELAPAMAAVGWGRIVCVGSLYSRFGVARTAAYTASKHALLGLTRVLAAEYPKRGVTANAIIPGFVDTEMVREEAEAAAAARDLSREEIVKRFLRIQPIGRMVSVEEVGALVAYLCSEAAAPVTGQAIDIDGGAFQA